MFILPKVFVAAFLICGLIAHTSTTTLADDSPADILTDIESPRWRDRETTHRRFAFLLNQFSDLCPVDNEQKASNADMLAVIFGKFREAGLEKEEGLLALSNSLYTLTVEVSSLATLNDATTPTCVDIWSMYATLRLKGQSSDAARDGITQILIGLYSLGESDR